MSISVQGNIGPPGYGGRKGRKGVTGKPGPPWGHMFGKNAEMGDGSYMGLVSASEMAEVGKTYFTTLCTYEN